MAKLNIFLGHKCNFKCSYCLQSFKDSDYLHKDDIDVPKLVSKLADKVKEQSINKIAYWGGEPLLYFKTIKEIHNEFLKLGIRFNNTRILTNGSLLTDEAVEFFNSIDCHIGVSLHKGFGEPKWDKLKNLNRWSIINLYTGRNPKQDFIAEAEELEQSLGREVFPFIHWVRATDNCSKEDYFTVDTLLQHREKLYELADLAISGNVKARNMLQPHINKMIHKLNQNNFNGAMCCNNRIISVDLYGNTYSCYHSPTKENLTGNIFKTIERNTVVKALETQMQFVNSKECMKCDIRSWCRGNCYLSNTHEIDCTLQKIKYEVFSYILKHQ